VKHHAARRDDTALRQHFAALAVIQEVAEEWHASLGRVHAELVRPAGLWPEPKKGRSRRARGHFIPRHGFAPAAPRPGHPALGVFGIN
jgi:hypothetical protein